MLRCLGILAMLALLCGPVLADPPGTSACGSGGVNSHGDPCVGGKTTAGAADKTPLNGAGGTRGSGGSGGHGR
jgi:hypothetical protein